MSPTIKDTPSTMGAGAGDAKPNIVLTPIERYLTLYNQISAVLWTIVLTSTVFLALTTGQPYLFDATNFSLTVIQTFAVMEIYNSLRGYVKAPVFTTAAQVSSRLLVVCGIFRMLPGSPAGYHWSYITLCLAWSITEIVRYTYYAQNLVTKGNPSKILILLRYNLFFVLYPLGVFSELCLIYLSLEEAEAAIGSHYSKFLLVAMGLYAPGFYTLFGHMLIQRKKAMKALYTQKTEGKKEN